MAYNNNNNRMEAWRGLWVVGVDRYSIERRGE